MVNESSSETCVLCCVCQLDVASAQVLLLTCNHTICTSCGDGAAKFGHQACPLCRAPHLLDVRSLRARFCQHRHAYGQWRRGKSSGSKGELSNLHLPPRLSDQLPSKLLHPIRHSSTLLTMSTDGDMFHRSCGIIIIPSSTNKLAPRLQASRPTLRNKLSCTQSCIALPCANYEALPSAAELPELPPELVHLIFAMRDGLRSAAILRVQAVWRMCVFEHSNWTHAHPSPHPFTSHLPPTQNFSPLPRCAPVDSPIVNTPVCMSACIRT